ncbi:adhesion G protein-coupled receptor B1 [Patella vulgata]|uniref:adhesion G protein-coupled receptor B1 n=1 Tax=Patella vulgata TaxID=6465 RepID=UPI0021805D4C|nr:adhesion G protein-coupled receptor B1 [Patella vulgata]
MAIGLYYGCLILTLLFVSISTQNCGEDQVGGYQWNATKSGDTSELPCRTPNHPGFVFRTCKNGTWEQPIFSNCPTPMRSERSIIELINYIGCGLSIFCCLLTIVFYIFFYKHISGSLTVLVTSLCLAVITSNIFLIIGLHRVESKDQCRIISVCLQYFPTVAVFTLSTIIIHILTTSFKKTNKCCIVASLFVSWVLPGAVVAGYAAYTKLEEYGNPVNCWVQINTRLWWVYIGTILAMVFIMLLAVFGSIYRSYIDRIKRHLRIGVIPLFVVCMFTILTWVIGTLSVNEYHDNLYVLQIVFAVFNILQGFTILMIFGLQSTKVTQLSYFLKIRMFSVKALYFIVNMIYWA